MGIFKTGNISVSVDSVTLGLKLDVNYNWIPCVISLDIPHSKLGVINVDLSDLDPVSRGAINLAVNLFKPRITNFIILKFKQAIREPIDKLDFERYRP